MNDFQAIQQRKSRRKYLPTPIPADKVRTLTELIETFNAHSGLQIEFIDDGGEAFNGVTKSYGLFSGVRSLLLLKGPVSDPYLKEKCGYYGEKLVLEATKMDLGTCWVGGTFDARSPIFKTEESQSLICVITIGVIPEEKGFGEKLLHSLIHRKTKALETFYTADATPPQWFLDGVAAVQLAPSAMHTQKVRLKYEDHRTTIHISESFKMDLIDLGIAKYHFEIGSGGKFEWGNPGLFTP